MKEIENYNNIKNDKKSYKYKLYEKRLLVKKMAGGIGFGWQLFGTILCALLLTLPFVIGFLIYRSIVKRAAKRKESQEKEELMT